MFSLFWQWKGLKIGQYLRNLLCIVYIFFEGGHPVYVIFRITHYVISSVILYAFYKLNGGKLTFVLISFVRRAQNDV